MSKQVLDIQQMQHLKELGVDTSKAGMALVYRNKYGDIVDWNIVDKDVHEYGIGQYNSYIRSIYGAFTLQDILDLLPKKLQHIYEDYELTLFYSNDSYDWKIQYLNENVSFMDYKSGEELIDAAYEMLCWCAENGYVETNK